MITMSEPGEMTAAGRRNVMQRNRLMRTTASDEDEIVRRRKDAPSHPPNEKPLSKS